jgi:hypothetical protein
MHRFRSLLVALLCLVMASAAFAQSGNVTTGSISGTVADSSGGALPGVTVTVTNTQTGLTRSLVTENDGRYTAQLLPPGTYRVEAELAGLGRAQRPNVTVLLGNTTTVDLAINPQVSEQITVTATAPVVDVEQSGQTVSVTTEQIQNLPLLGRDFLDLVSLTPGAGETFNSGVSLNGARGIAADYNIDGAETNSDFFGQQRGGSRPPFTFSQAAIQEFQVIRAAYQAEFGRGVGGTLNAITKSGTNDLQGQAFYYHRDKDWATGREISVNGNPFEEFVDTRDSKQYGFALGGPIVRDRLFYFVNTDMQDISIPASVFDIRSRAEFTALPAATQSAFVSRIEQLTGRSFAENLQYTSTEDQKTYLIKFDANLGNHHLSFRDNYSDFQNAFNQPVSTTNTYTHQGIEHDKFNQAVVSAESVFGASLFNQLIVQYGEEERPIVPTFTGIPDIRIAGGTPLSMTIGQLDFLPNNTIEEKWQIKNATSYMFNNHTIKGGIEFLFAEVDNAFTRDASGQYEFTSIQNFLDNRPSFFEQGAGDILTNAYGVDTFGFFVQDTWKRNNLTLDFGVRYDVQTMPEPIRNVTPYPELSENFNQDTDNIAPRLGFAYDIFNNGRSVVRGGVGKFYNNLPAILLAQPIQGIEGQFSNIRVNCANVQCPTFPNLFTLEQVRSMASVTDLAIVSPDLEAQESLRTSLGFEQQLGTSYSVGLEGSYSKLDKQQRFVNVNAVRSTTMFGNLPFFTVGGPNSAFPKYQNVRMHVSDAEGSYKSATISTRKLALENSKFSWTAHYTWSEAIDQDSNERSTSTSFSLDPFDPELSEGRADYDITHRAVLSGTYELPFGFFVSGIFNWRTGQPYTIGIGGTNFNGANVTGVDVPTFVDADGNVIDLTAASGLSRAGLAQFLNSRGAVLSERNGENQPDFKNLDLRLSKRFNLTRGFEIELIGEIFNAFNWSNANVGTNNRRAYSFSYNAGQDRYTFTRNATFGQLSAFTGVPRQYQVATRVIF